MDLALGGAGANGAPDDQIGDELGGDRIEQLAAGKSSATFVCECLQEECDEPVSLTLEEYEQIRAGPNRFFVLNGHEFDEIEETIEANDRYLVVMKLGVGAEVAATLDPRTREARHVERA